MAIASWRSACGSGDHQTPNLTIATARAGNVIGGGDWADDRIIPDAMRSLSAEKHSSSPTGSNSSMATCSEPLGGYLLLAEKLVRSKSADENSDSINSKTYESAFNFGPGLEANRTVRELVEAALSHWPGSWSDLSDTAPHEAGRLHLQTDKAYIRWDEISMEF